MAAKKRHSRKNRAQREIANHESVRYGCIGPAGPPKFKQCHGLGTHMIIIWAFCTKVEHLPSIPHLGSDKKSNVRQAHASVMRFKEVAMHKKMLTTLAVALTAGSMAASAGPATAKTFRKPVVHHAYVVQPGGDIASFSSSGLHVGVNRPPKNR
jgi:hypothetical protein